jgi:hypothetical protein
VLVSETREVEPFDGLGGCSHCRIPRCERARIAFDKHHRRGPDRHPHRLPQLTDSRMGHRPAAGGRLHWVLRTRFSGITSGP